MADVRALRNRNVNIITENANGAGAPSKRGLKPEGKEGKEEPKPKRAALTEISTNVNQACEAISNVLIDSTKKVLDAVPKARGSKRSNSASELAVISEEVVAAKPAEEDPCPEYDFDAETGNDPYSVSEYARDIFKYYKYFIVGDYFKKQKHITRENRAVIGDWMVEVQESFELNHETLYLAVKLVDLYLDRTKDHKKKDDLQVIASTAVFIASKFDERQPPMVDDFMYICGDSFTRDELTDMERDMLDVVGFDLGAPLSYRYLRRYSRVVKAPMDTLTLARFILETSLMFYEFVDASECLMAAGAFLLALRMKDSTANWSPVLRKYSGLSEVMVEEAASVLNHMMWIRPRVFPKLDTVFKKYSHEVFFQSALVPMLPDSLPAEAPLSFPKL